MTVPALTIGMATYRDFDGVYFTIQALRLYQDLDDVEIVVVDNFGCPTTQEFVEKSGAGRYLRYSESTGTAAPRAHIFHAARAPAVLCLDCHVLLAPGAIARLKRYYRAHPDTLDLLQGPMLHDDLERMASHLNPRWTASYFGHYAIDRRAENPEGKPFAIPMQGLGLFSCRREAWPGFHPRFRGWGGEEGYLHQKFYNLGRRCLCLPWLRWLHRFPRPNGIPYTVSMDDRVHNYLVGHAEVGLSLRALIAHLAEHVAPETLAAIAEESLGRRIRVPGLERSPKPSNGHAAVGTARGSANGSMMGKWNPWFEGQTSRTSFGARASYRAAARFLKDLPLIEDWGCGLGWFRKYVRAGQYRGLDGSATPFADRQVDLVSYTSAADGILLRHVLEHNHQWQRILRNALRSFRRKLCLVFFLPFAERTHVVCEQDLGQGAVPSYRFRKADIVRRFPRDCTWSEQSVGEETIFFLERRQ